MSSIRFVLDSGVCIADSGSSPVNYAQHRGLSFSRGQVCSACLVGSWPQTLLRTQQYLCASCQHLGQVIATAEQTSWALGNQDGVRHIARELRAERLTNVFNEAALAGTTVATTPDGDRELGYANYLAQVGGDAPARAQRFAEWVQTIDPDLAAAWAVALADVDHLTDEMHRHHRRVLRGQVRARAERAGADLRRGARGLSTVAPVAIRAVVSRRA